MVEGHHFFKTGAEAAARSILAGCDLDCGMEYRQNLKEALEKGFLDVKDLDRALERFSPHVSDWVNSIRLKWCDTLRFQKKNSTPKKTAIWH